MYFYEFIQLKLVVFAWNQISIHLSNINPGTVKYPRGDDCFHSHCFSMRWVNGDMFLFCMQIQDQMKENNPVE